MNPIMMRIALWFSETFVASALEVFLETIIEVWNYSIIKYDLPLSCINVNQANVETRNHNPSTSKLLKLTDDLIDFSHDEIAMQNLPQIGDASGGNIADSSDIVTPLKILTCTLSNELEVSKESPAFDGQSVNISNQIITEKDGSEQSEIHSHVDNNGKNSGEKRFKQHLNFDDGDNSNRSRHCKSPELRKECDEEAFLPPNGNISQNSFWYKIDLDDIIRIATSEIREQTLLNGEHSKIESTNEDFFENNKDLYSELRKEKISNKMKAITENDPFTVSESCLEYIGNTMQGENSNFEVMASVIEKKESFLNKQIEVKNQDSNINFMNPVTKNMKSLSDKRRKVQFSDDVKTFVYEPERNVYHPCIILKSPISFREKETFMNYQTTVIIEDVEETVQSCVIKKKEKGNASMSQQNTILDKLRTYEERQKDDNCYLSDESDASDVSSERESKIEGWVQQTTEDDKFLLDDDYQVCKCSSQRRRREGDSKASKIGRGNVRLNKAAATAARKQSKDILDRICKKLFQQKSFIWK